LPEEVLFSAYPGCFCQQFHNWACFSVLKNHTVTKTAGTSLSAIDFSRFDWHTFLSNGGLENATK
jgi:organic hydroperoxide reductase OsmC/OhrA